MGLALKQAGNQTNEYKKKNALLNRKKNEYIYEKNNEKPKV